MRFRDSIRAGGSLAVIAFVAFAGQAYAQSAPTNPPAAPAEEDEEMTTVDQIVVTAQKREQNLQDVPVVVTTISEELLEDAGVRDIQDLQILAPGLRSRNPERRKEAVEALENLAAVASHLKHLLLVRDLRRIAR